MPPTAPARATLRCAQCGYDLAATPIVDHQITCPECGGHRVWLPRWYEPLVPFRRALLYVPLSLVGVVLPVLAINLATARWGQSWLTALIASPPFLWLALMLVLWRPSLHAGVCIIGFTVVLASLCAIGAGLSLLLPLEVMPAAAVPLAAAYYIVPVPLGLGWARSLLD